MSVPASSRAAVFGQGHRICVKEPLFRAMNSGTSILVKVYELGIKVNGCREIYKEHKGDNSVKL